MMISIEEVIANSGQARSEWIENPCEQTAIALVDNLSNELDIIEDAHVIKTYLEALVSVILEDVLGWEEFSAKYIALLEKTDVGVD